MVGHCKHGEFDLVEGCPQCVDEKLGINPNRTEPEFVPALDQNEFEDHTAEDAEYEWKRDNAEILSLPSAETNEIRDQINAVVDAREKAQKVTTLRTESYQDWERANSLLIETEKIFKESCLEAETKLRELALLAYAATRDKAVAPGIGIRIMTRLGYDSKDAMGWAMEHKLALKLDSSAFEKIAKTSNLPFVNITEEPSATIATELQKVE